MLSIIIKFFSSVLLLQQAIYPVPSDPFFSYASFHKYMEKCIGLLGEYLIEKSKHYLRHDNVRHSIEDTNPLNLLVVFVQKWIELLNNP